MSLLMLDTRFRGQASAWLIGEGEERCLQGEGDVQGILRLMQTERQALASIEGVAIVAGPGRFSALRVGIVYAHILVRWFRVPLYTLLPEEGESVHARQQTYQAIASGTKLSTRFAVPLYDKEPNITLPRTV